jgi:tetratricopeptide (TPR) repeat protein
VYLLAQAAKAAPSRPEISLALARASQSGGFYGDSLLAYDRYLAARPEDEIVRRDRALVSGFTRAGQSEAVAYLDAYVVKHPSDAVAFYDLAQLSYRANRSTALPEVSKALQLDPRLAPAFFFRAWLLNKAGRYAESLSDAETAAKLNAKDARALDLIGLDNLELGRVVVAEKPLRRAVSLSPNEPDFLFHLGRALLEQGKREEARPILAQFQKVREQWTPAPREAPGVIESATLSPHELARRVVADYQEAVRTNPNELALRLNLGRALLAAHETDEALAAFRRMLSIQPPAALSAEAGSLLLENDQYELACAFLKRSADEVPASRLDLAVALYFQGDLNSSWFWRLKATRLLLFQYSKASLMLPSPIPESRLKRLRCSLS